ncbi:MAG: hypothetical protein ACOC4R_00345 [Bacteroidota bacterium]
MKIFLTTILSVLVMTVSAQIANKNILFVGFQQENIIIDKSVEQYAKSMGITTGSVQNQINAAAINQFRKIAGKNKYNALGLDDQVSLLSSEFSELTSRDRIDLMQEEEKGRTLPEIIFGLFDRNVPASYMSAKFSEDKTSRIKATLARQNSNYAVILHKYEIKRNIWGHASLATHFSVVNQEGKIVFGAQHVYHVDMKRTMKKEIFSHLIRSGFMETYSIIFDKLA